MGQRCSDTRMITFEDVVVPKEVVFWLAGIIGESNGKICLRFDLFNFN